MTQRNYTNTALPQALTVGIGPGDTTLDVGSTASFPATPFTLVLERNIPANKEVVLCTGVPSATQLTVTRGLDGTTAIAHSIGAAVEHAVAATDFEDANDHIYDIGRDDHTQYFDATRHDAHDHSSVIPAFLPPVGAITPYAGTADPSADWLICDGRAISRTTYATLFALVGVTYGPGNGTTTFNIPDLRGRFPLGNDEMGTMGGAGRIANGQGNVIAGSGGEEAHLLTSNEMPSHTHTQNPHLHTGAAINAGDHNHLPMLSAPASLGFVVVRSGGSADTVAGSALDVDVQTRNAGDHGHTLNIDQTTSTNNLTGGGLPHNNLPPFLTLSYIVRVL
jgi:microcystin-dependent protein